MAGEKQVNYTAEMTAQVLEMYGAGEKVETIAQTVGRTVRSVIAKLSREGVYQSKAKVAGTKRNTKAELIAQMADKIGVNTEQLETLEKASKEALELVLEAL